MKLKCPDCAAMVTAKGNGAVRCPKCGFTARVPGQTYSAPAPRPNATTTPPKPAANVAQSAANPTPAAAGTAPGQQTNGVAIAALVTGLVGFIGLFPASIAAVILGIVGLNQCKERNQPGDGMALAGLILGAIGCLFLVVIFASGPWFWLH